LRCLSWMSFWRLRWPTKLWWKISMIYNLALFRLTYIYQLIRKLFLLNTHNWLFYKANT
jgi:hypothetical protein